MDKSIKIDTKLLSSEIEKLNIITGQMDELFCSIKKNTDSLHDVWETRTSASVFSEFEQFYKLCDNVKVTNENDAKFLKNIVNSGYENLEDNTNTIIDTNIAIKE